MEEYFVAATYIAVTQLTLSRRIVPENKEYYGVPPASTVAGESCLRRLNGSMGLHDQQRITCIHTICKTEFMRLSFMCRTYSS